MRLSRIGFRTDTTTMNAHEPHIPVTDIQAASRRNDCLDAVRNLYVQVDRQLDVHASLCRKCGRCCHFGQFGHRLYVTVLEASFYLSACGSPRPITSDACPHAFDGRCHAREVRPVGCRIFYCDPQTAAWQGPLTETWMGRLRRLHAQLGVPYVYADWMAVLDALSALCEPSEMPGVDGPAPTGRL